MLPVQSRGEIASAETRRDADVELELEGVAYAGAGLAVLSLGVADASGVADPVALAVGVSPFCGLPSFL